MTTLEDVLTELESLLYGRDYQVFLRVYRAQFLPSAPPERYVYEALGSHVTPQLEPTTGPQLLGEVDRALRYAGDEHSGPDPRALESLRFKTLVQSVQSDLAKTIAQATFLVRFTLRHEHHPAYPVYWDFAYVIAGPSGGLVFIGSS